LNFGLKTLDSDCDAALDLWADLVFGLDPRDKERLHEMQTQGTAWYRDFLVNSAIHAALVAAGRSQSPIGWLRHLWHSPLTYQWMQHLTDGFEAHAEELMQGIEEVRDWLFDPTRWTWSFTGSDEAFSRVERKLGEWRDRMNRDQVSRGRINQEQVNQERATSVSNGTGPLLRPGKDTWDGAQGLPGQLGLAAPVDVQFCARAFPAPPREVEPLVQLGLGAMSFDHFLPEIRLKGNAYGGGCSLDTSGGVLQFYSYRDPRLSETLGVFDAARDWVAAQQWSADDLERVLLGDARGAVPAIRPGEATGQALDRLRRGETATMRAADYQRKMAASPDEVKTALLSYLDDAWPKATTAVAASRAALESANAERREKGQAELVIQEMLPEAKLPEVNP
jgi:Zn-dependent M16 (insulinase) family peptidase